MYDVKPNQHANKIYDIFGKEIERVRTNFKIKATQSHISEYKNRFQHHSFSTEEVQNKTKDNEFSCVRQVQLHIELQSHNEGMKAFHNGFGYRAL